MTKLPRGIKGLQAIHQNELQLEYPRLNADDYFDSECNRSENEEIFVKVNHGSTSGDQTDAEYYCMLHEDDVEQRKHGILEIYEEAADGYLTEYPIPGKKGDRHPREGQNCKDTILALRTYIQEKVRTIPIADEESGELALMTFDLLIADDLIRKRLKFRWARSTIAEALLATSPNKARFGVRTKISVTQDLRPDRNPVRHSKHVICLECKLLVPCIRSSRRFCNNGDSCKMKYFRKKKNRVPQ